MPNVLRERNTHAVVTGEPDARTTGRTSDSGRGHWKRSRTPRKPRQSPVAYRCSPQTPDRRCADDGGEAALSAVAGPRNPIRELRKSREAGYCGGFSSASRNAWPEAFFRLATQASSRCLSVPLAL